MDSLMQAVSGMGYPSEAVARGLDEERVTDRYAAAAFGWRTAVEMVAEAIGSHGGDGWTYCGDGENLPEGPFGCIVTVIDTDPTMEDFENVLPYCAGYDGYQWNDENGEEIPFDVIAWRPMPEAYRPQKSVGDDYKRQIMERFCRVE